MLIDILLVTPVSHLISSLPGCIEVRFEWSAAQKLLVDGIFATHSSSDSTKYEYSHTFSLT